MVSQFAIAEIENLQADGLNPTPRDIIRLNAYALKIEAAQGKSPTSNIFLLPRVATIATEDAAGARHIVTFRQPTVGHEIWLDTILRHGISNVAFRDYQTVLAVNAYALSRDHSHLVDPYSPAELREAVDCFCSVCAPFTTDHIFAAVNYVKHGCDPATDDRPPKCRADDDPEVREDLDDVFKTADWDQCIQLGNLYRGVSVMWGATLADLKSMTPRQLRECIRTAARFHDRELDDGIEHAQAQFYAVLDEIRNRLTQADNGNQ